MSTQPTAPTPTDIPVLPVVPAAPVVPETETDWKAETEKWKALSRKNEEASKANKTAADELATLKAAQMTEAEKSAARTAALEAENAGYKTEKQVAAWKAQVSTETGVPVAALAGSTLEDLQAHAAVLKTLITNPQAPRGPIVPTEGTGSDAPPGVSQITDAVLATMTPEQINEARRAGRLNKILGIN